MAIKFTMSDDSAKGKKRLANAKGFNVEGDASVPKQLESKNYTTSQTAYTSLYKAAQYGGGGVSVSAPNFFSPMFTPQNWQVASRRKELYQWLYLPCTQGLMEDFTYKNLFNIDFDSASIIEDTVTGGILHEGITYPKILDSEGNFSQPTRFAVRDCVDKRCFSFSATGYYRNLKISEEHKILILDGNEYRKNNKQNSIKKVEAQDVKSNDYLLTTVPNCGNKKIDSKIAWLIGFCIADGCIYKSKTSHTISFTGHKEEKSLKVCEEYLKSIYDSNISSKTHGDGNGWRVCVTTKKALNDFREYIINKSTDKKFTSKLFELDRESRLRVIAGYLDGDGSFSKAEEIIIANCYSKDLADQLYWLCLSCGIQCSLTRYPLYGEHYETNSEWCYRILIPSSNVNIIAPYMNSEKVPVNYESKKVRELKFFYTEDNITYFAQPISKIEQFYYTGKGFDLEMPNKGHALIASGYACSNCRFYYESEPKVAAGVDFYVQFPMNGFKLECKNKKVLRYYEGLISDLKLMNWCKLISHEYFLIGDVFPFLTIECPHCGGKGVKSNGKPCNHPDGKIKSITILNPDYVEVDPSPFPDQRPIHMIPDEQLKKTVLTREPKSVYDKIPDQLKKMIASGQKIKLSPRSVSHIKHGESAYGIYGTSILRRLFQYLAYKTKLMTANWIVAERLVLPVRVIMIGEPDNPAGPEDIADMQQQITAVANDPNLTIVTHHAFKYDWYGASGKIHNITAELELVGKEILDGLMLNQALLNGEMGGYSAAQVGIETLLKRLDNWRDKLSEWIEEHIFKPTAMMQGFQDDEASKEAGRTVWLYPSIKWEDMQLRDKSNKLQMYMQLHDKKLISTEKLFEEFDIDYDQEMSRLRSEQIESSPGGIIPEGGGGMPMGGGMDMLGGGPGGPGGPPPDMGGGMAGGMPGAAPGMGGPGSPSGGMEGGGAPPIGASSTQKVYKKGKAPKHEKQEYKKVAPTQARLTKLEQKVWGLIKELQMPFKLFGQYQKQLPGEQQPFKMDFALPQILLDVECVHPEQSIPTEFGSKMAKDISIGEKLIGRDGSLVTIEEKFINKSKNNMLSIKAHGCLPIKITDNHPMLIAKPKKVSRLSNEPSNTRYRTYLEPGNQEFINAIDVKIGDFLIIPKTKINKYIEEISFSDHNNRESNINARKLPDKIKLDSDFGWLLGIYAAEGCADKEKSNITFSFDIKENDLIEKTMHLILKLFNFKSSRYDTIDNNCSRVTIGSKIFAQFLNENFGRGAKNKKLPYWIFSAPDEFVNSFMLAFREGDGCLSKNGKERYISSSKNMLLDMQRLLAQRGKLATLCLSRNPGTTSTFNRKGINKKYINAGLWELAYYKSSKERHYEDENNFYVPIRSISFVEYDGDVINFKTSGNEIANHTYCIGNLVSHNCDGEIWHEKEGAKERDAIRDKKLSNYGWRVLRLAEDAINENPNEVKDLIYKNIKEAAEEHFSKNKKASSSELSNIKYSEFTNELGNPNDKRDIQFNQDSREKED